MSDERMSQRAVYAFECNIVGTDWYTVINARSAGQAKAEYIRGVRDAWPSIPFTAVRARKLGAPRSSAEFMWCADRRRVRFRCGDRVRVCDSGGVIVGHNSSANFDVLFDDDDTKYPGQRLSVHPADITPQ